MLSMSRLAAIVLLGGMATSLSGQMFEVALFEPIRVQPTHSAGCHGESPKNSSRDSSPEPTSYRCCLAGHLDAILRSSVPPPRPPVGMHDACEVMPSFLTGVANNNSPIFVALSNSPPGIVPLRI